MSDSSKLKMRTSSPQNVSPKKGGVLIGDGLCCAGRAANKAAALAFVHANSDPKATHNCYAYQFADGTVKSANDGEPSGTAGKPIAAAIGGSGFTDVVVLVVRHYGGVKLGSTARLQGCANPNPKRGCHKALQTAPAAISPDLDVSGLIGTGFP